MKVLFQKARIVDPYQKIDAVSDLLIHDGKVSKIQSDIQDSDAQKIDAKDLIMAPGLIDIHVHFREPGQEHKETLASGSRAAAAGGFSQVCCMANTVPPIDNRAMVELIKSIAQKESLIKIHPIAAVTRQMKGEELVDMGELIEAGVIAFSDDGLPISSAQVMRRALEYSSQWSHPIVVHEEDMSLVNGGVMNEGLVSTQLGLAGNPSLSEEVMVARDIELIRVGGKIHFAHLSSGRSLELIREARKRKLKVTTETAPHYLVLTDEALAGYNTHCKMAPPLRSEADRLALIEGLKDGSIDCIATDHAPHSADDKHVDFNQARFGVIGLETSLPVMFSYFVSTGILSLTRLIELMSLKPAQIMNLQGGHLSVGMPADLVLFDPAKKQIVDPKKFASKSGNCPFAGWELSGWPIQTWVDGRKVFEAQV